MNGDGLPDKVVSNGDGTYTVYFNTGKGFSSTGVTWEGISTRTPGGSQPPYGWANLQAWDDGGTRVTLIDMNGDGLVDRVIRSLDGSGTNMVVQYNTGPFPDLLIGVANGIGGSVAIAYTPSSHWNNSDGTRPRLPLPMYTVTSITEMNGGSTVQQWNYSYLGGLYDTHWREFRGFSEVTESYLNGTGGNMTDITCFYQGGGLNNSSIGEYQDSRFKAGMPFKKLTYGSDGRLYKVLAYQVEQVEINANGVYFPFTAGEFELDYEGASVPRESLETYQYAAYLNDLPLSTGNLLQEGECGEITNFTYQYAYAPVSGTPNAFTTYTYASLSNLDIVDKPASVTLSSDAAGNNVLRQTLYTYFGETGDVQQKKDLYCPGTYGITSYTYDNYGNIQTTTDPMDLVTTENYDSSATFETQNYTGSLTNSYQYDPGSGNLLSSTNAQGMVTANQYDGLLRLTNSAISTTPFGPATLWRKRYQYVLGTGGNWIYEQINDPASSTGYYETYDYLDGLGRPVEIREQSETSGTYRVSDIFYNPLGEITAQTYPVFESGAGYGIPNGSINGFYTIVDPIGRPCQFYPVASASFSSGVLTSLTPLSGDSGSPVGPTTLAFVDGANPWAIVVTDPRGNKSKYELDAFGRTNQIIEVVGNSNYVTKLFYDAADDLTNITDSAGNQTSFFYDEMGNRVAMAEPDMGLWQWQYDLDSRLVVQTDAKGQKIESFYNDPAGRITAREGLNSGGQVESSASWQYDSSDGDSSCTIYPGQIYAITDDQGYEKFSDDVRNRTRESVRYVSQNGNSYTNLFAYDDADREVLESYPNGGPTITNIYDSGEHLSEVQLVGGSGTAFYTARAFNGVNQLLGVSFGNGVLTSNTYYPVSLRLENLAGTHLNTSIQSLTYGYDTNGNISGITDGVYSGAASAAFGNVQYDALDRMISLTNAAGSFVYGYSSVGNILTNEESGFATNYVYGTTIRPNCVRYANGIIYTYDLDGNVANREGMRIIYDVNNNLQYALTPTNTVQFGYDVKNERLWEQNGTNPLQVWIGDTYEEKQGEILYHIYAGNRLVATFDKTSTNIFQYYQPNNLTSTSIQTDTNGNVVNHYEYSAFGQSRYTQSTNVFQVSRRFTGQILDDATGLYYYNARYYDPILGRFIEPDHEIPEFDDPQSYNRYTYCLNDPLRFTDPNGDSAIGNAVDYTGNFVIGFGVEVGMGMHVSAPTTESGYNGRAAGRALGGLVSAGLIIKGTKDTAAGAGMVTVSALSIPVTAGLDSELAVPGMADGELTAARGGALTAAGAWGINNLHKLSSLTRPAGPAGGAEIHHIATNKNRTSTAGGGPFTPKFEQMFKQAGMTLKDALNEVQVLNHKGPHPEYNAEVYDRLENAVRGLKGNAYKSALQAELKAIGKESSTPGTALNKLITK